MSQPKSPSITLRPVTAQDHAFLRELYDSTREQEISLIDWLAEQKEQFLNMQFLAQLSHYQEHFPSGEHDVILLDGEPVGRLYVERRDYEIRLLDITLSPRYRNRGIGGRIIQDLLHEAQEHGLPVRLYVWENNHAAYRLYTRLGFRDVEKQSVYIFMEWLPEIARGVT